MGALVGAFEGDSVGLAVFLLAMSWPSTSARQTAAHSAITITTLILPSRLLVLLLSYSSACARHRTPEQHLLRNYYDTLQKGASAHRPARGTASCPRRPRLVHASAGLLPARASMAAPGASWRAAAALPPPASTSPDPSWSSASAPASHVAPATPRRTGGAARLVVVCSWRELRRGSGAHARA